MDMWLAWGLSGVIGGAIGGGLVQMWLRQRLRDELAMAALTGMLARGVPPDNGFANMAYAWATVMLAERKKSHD